MRLTVVCVAEGTFQVASAKAYKNGGTSSLHAFSLQRVEYFVNGVLHFSYIATLPSLS